MIFIQPNTAGKKMKLVSDDFTNSKAFSLQFELHSMYTLQKTCFEVLLDKYQKLQILKAVYSPTKKHLH